LAISGLATKNVIKYIYENSLYKDGAKEFKNKVRDSKKGSMLLLNK